MAFRGGAALQAGRSRPVLPHIVRTPATPSGLCARKNSNRSPQCCRGHDAAERLRFTQRAKVDNCTRPELCEDDVFSIPCGSNQGAGSMNLVRIAIAAVVALSAVEVGSTADAADPAEKRIDRNFKPGKKRGKRISAIPVSALRIAKGNVKIQIDGREHRLETLTVTPPGSGPFPLAVVSHGTPTRGGRDALRRLRIRMLLPIAEDFARRGYKAVVFARRGYASSTGPFAESYGRCSDASQATFFHAALEGAKDFGAVIDAFARRPDVDGSTIIAAGHSGGGFAASALAIIPPHGLTGIVNFAGGRGGAGKGENCSETGFVGAFGEFGKGARVPALWLYSTTDRLFGPELVGRAFEAYAGRGAPVRLDMVGPLWFTGNGHMITALGARELWRPRIDDFLNAIGVPNWKRAPDGAAVERVPPPPGLGSGCYNWWHGYLGYGGHKAFATSDDGYCGPSRWHDTVERARAAAMRRCERRGSGCRIVSVDGKIVP
ncbi:MAG: hypothetical protein OXM58_12730 [Rhodospirillaceae bacterium]|nr:hypothetical protein [Rhodospirillaceae bacterium]MDE0619067.1 hypothetical protein [Rhodospirillaceae bacterium]